MQNTINALSYIYHKAQKERDVKLIQIYNIVNCFFKKEKTKQLMKFCEITEKVAVHALKMTEYQRKKYRHLHYNLNGHTYYIFDRLSVWNVGILAEKDKYIYE
jgi:hypothetical protein